MSDDMLEAEERMSGFPCPRREWPDGEGPYLFRLVQLGASAERAHLFDALFRIRYGDTPAAYQERMLMRVLRAHADEQVGLALWPERHEGEGQE